MASICSTCLGITEVIVKGRCRPCARDYEATRRPPAHERYPAEYRANRRIVLASGPLCHWCGTMRATTADHVVPVAKGGGHDLGNLVPACQRCNSGRGDMDADEWAEVVRTRGV